MRNEAGLFAQESNSLFKTDHWDVTRPGFSGSGYCQHIVVNSLSGDFSLEHYTLTDTLKPVGLRFERLELEKGAGRSGRVR